MRSFGVLSNSLALWREVRVWRNREFVVQRYARDRVAVKSTGVSAYRAMRFLHLSQGLVMCATLFAVIASIGLFHEASPAQLAGAIVSGVGVCLASMYPLHTIGFGISSLAVSTAQAAEAHEKIHRHPSDAPSVHNDFAFQLRGAAQDAAKTGRPVWVIGPSGSGKTRALESFLSLGDAPSPTHEAWLEHWPEITYDQQDPVLLNATAIANVDFGRALDPAQIDRILRELDLAEFTLGGARAEHDVAGEDAGVSGGERARICLARALICPPGSLVVLDEPTANLDAARRAVVWGTIERCARDRCVVVATHDAGAPRRDGDRVIALAALEPSREGAESLEA